MRREGLAGLVTAGPGDELHCQSVDPYHYRAAVAQVACTGVQSEACEPRWDQRMTPRGLVGGFVCQSFVLELWPGTAVICDRRLFKI